MTELFNTILDAFDEIADIENNKDFKKEVAKVRKEHEKLTESQEKDITIDFPITVNEKGRIKANDAKKLLKYLAANKMLRLGRTWYVKDPTGRETCWSLMKGYFDEYVFSCEITDSIEDENGNYDELDWYNGLSFSKSNGKLTDFEWESYKVN